MGRDARDQRRRRGRRPAARRGFTLIEVLIIIAVIGILVAALGLMGSHLLGSQKAQLTRSIIAGCEQAVTQFAEVNPLAGTYDRGRTTFGPYPPYQLHGSNQGTVAAVLEPIATRTANYNLKTRLARDIAEGNGNRVNLIQNDDRDDIRAFYAYLRTFTPDALAEVPGSAQKSLTDDAERILAPPGNSSQLDVPILGIMDGWGVPLDYFLYVKLEPDTSTSPIGWKVTSRTPVFRSRGIDRELYDAWLSNPGAPPPDTKDTWIFSADFPTPAFGGASNNAQWNSGALPSTVSASTAGWARALGVLDPFTSAGREHPSAYGFVP